MIPYDLEETLVHELLHLTCAPFEPEHGSLAHTLMEQTIDMLAKTLVRLKRGGVDVGATLETQAVAAET